MVQATFIGARHQEGPRLFGFTAVCPARHMAHRGKTGKGKTPLLTIELIIIKNIYPYRVSFSYRSLNHQGKTNGRIRGSLRTGRSSIGEGSKIPRREGQAANFQRRDGRSSGF